VALDVRKRVSSISYCAEGKEHKYESVVENKMLRVQTQLPGT
jgi:hypothetical protein